jgi:succinyl-diaminopimelate desuccinylase
MAQKPSHEKLWGEIDSQQDEVVNLCSGLVQIPTEAPPGDTSAAADYIGKLFDKEGIRYQVFEPRPGLKSLVAEWEGREPGPTLVLNGHIDEFPADDPRLWTYPPFSGKVTGGKIYGRGTADMKGGTSASIYTFLLFNRLNPPAKGKLRLMLVADEESGGQWGTDFILTQHPDWAGDACIIGEPSGLGAVRIGEKGQVWLKLESTATSYHAAIADGSGPIHDISQAVVALKKAISGRPGKTPAELDAVMKDTKDYPWFPRWRGREWVVDHFSMSFGVIRGGIKINIVPRNAEVEIDVRVPLGFDPEEVEAEVRRILKEQGLDLKMSRMLHHFCPANYTAPAHPFVQATKNTVTAVTGKAPVLWFSPTFTDTRLFRIRNVPAVICGPAPNNMAGPDEHITISDLIATTKVHSGVAWRFLVEGGLV